MNWTPQEWDQLTAEWLADTAEPDIGVELVRRANRYRRRLGWVVAVEVVITVVMGGAAFLALRQEPHRAAWLTYVATHIVVVWTFALWNRRGTLQPLQQTTRAYVDLMMLRCRRRLRSARFIIAVIAVHVPIAAWLLVTEAASPTRRLALAAVFVVMFACYLAAAAVMRSRARRELAELTRVSDSFATID